MKRQTPAWIRRPALAPVLSALIPGAGQLSLGQDRFVTYGALELVLWAKWAADLRDQSRQERQFRSLARQVPRVHFSATRPDGDWDYYEAMEKYFESGVFSLSDQQLVPERDSSTFNGGRWILAQRNNGVDPSAVDPGSSEYAAALAEYAASAVRPEFLWSWRNAQLEWDLYRRVIDRRNEAARAVGVNVTLILANHVLSTVDAFASYRLRLTVESGGRLGLRASLPMSGCLARCGAGRPRF